MSATTAPAFDAIAPSYDAEFTERRLGRWLREAVHERLAAAFAPGQHVLELGCGTGADAIWLARRGVHVTATDVSPGMLAVAEAKAERAGCGGSIRFTLLDLAQPHAFAPSAMFDGAFSNFGPLNCVADRRTLAAALAGWVRPGGRVILVMISPFCLWEIGWHLAHGEPATALRRLRSGVQAHVGAGASMPVWYPSPARLRAEFAPHFRHVATCGIGALLPPSYLHGLAERWPRMFETLALLDRHAGAKFPWTWLNDHYLISFERV